MAKFGRRVKKGLKKRIDWECDEGMGMIERRWFPEGSGGGQRRENTRTATLRRSPPGSPGQTMLLNARNRLE